MIFKSMLKASYKKITTSNEMSRLHPGVPTYKLERIKPSLRPYLDSRIVASANLIKLNRAKTIEETIQRFSGWATSIPKSGSDVVDKVEVKSNIMKSPERLDYEERRVAIDQGHKMLDAINDVISKQTGAIAGKWRSNYRQAGYDYREDHKERSDNIYLLRDSWAVLAGLVKVGPAGYTDQITRPAEEVNCRCYYVYISNLRDLPIEMLTQKGKDYLGIK
jgi:hypothetical protein